MTQTLKTIDVHTLKKQMDIQPDLCLIDVREMEEWEAQRIPGASLIPKDQIIVKIATQVSDKNQPIYLHCRSGARSLYAAQSLIEQGYQEVYSVDGGILEWAMQGYPVE
ncbi:MAG: rhodanese-like domain-containing protein [Legionella sp.]|nr:MAG: rhodanese-like domain-containing protein [Legionella sp.]